MTVAVAMKEVFDSWIDVYGKQYETYTEYDRRLEIFAENAEIVSKHNSEEHSYTSMYVILSPSIHKTMSHSCYACML